MGIITSYPDDSATTDSDKFLTSDTSGATKLTPASTLKDYMLPDSAITPAKLLAGTGTTWTWQSFTPSWTGLTVGNGTNTGKYIQIGKTIVFHIEFTLGTTSSVGASTIVNFPVTAVTYPQFSAIGTATYLTAAAGTIYWGKIAWNSTSQMRFLTDTIVGTTNRGADATTTSPFSFVTGSILVAHGIYSAA